MNKTLKYIVLLTFACFVGQGYAQELKSEVFSLLKMCIRDSSHAILKTVFSRTVVSIKLQESFALTKS